MTISVFQRISTGASTAIVATNENAPSEVATDAFDGSTSTKWLAFASTAAVTFSTTSPIIPTSYSIASANDWQSRDPRNWTLQGSNDRVSWTVIDSQSNQLFTNRYQYLTFSTNPGAYFKHYKLDITLNRDNDSATQLSEIKIYSSAGEMSVIR